MRFSRVETASEKLAQCASVMVDCEKTARIGEGLKLTVHGRWTDSGMAEIVIA